VSHGSAALNHNNSSLAFNISWMGNTSNPKVLKDCIACLLNIEVCRLAHCSFKDTYTLSRFNLAGCQMSTKATLLLPLLNWAGEKKYDKRLVGQDKDRERSLANYHQGKTDSI